VQTGLAPAQRRGGLATYESLQLVPALPLCTVIVALCEDELDIATVGDEVIIAALPHSLLLGITGEVYAHLHSANR